MTRVIRRALALASLLLLGAGGTVLADWTYTTQPGDTFWSISQATGVPVATLEAANPDISPWNVYPGLQMVIPTTDQQSPSSLSWYDIRLIAQAVVAEEGDKPFITQVGVAAVILNRLRTPGFPKTVPGVLFQPGQFTSVANGWFFQVSPTPTAIRATEDALQGWDPTGGALYFYDPGPDVTDAWIYSLPITADLGGTLFAA